MYVAVTRAKELLYLTYPIAMYDRVLGLVLGRPSRFLDGIPPALLRPMTLIEAEDTQSG